MGGPFAGNGPRGVGSVSHGDVFWECGMFSPLIYWVIMLSWRRVGYGIECGNGERGSSYQYIH